MAYSQIPDPKPIEAHNSLWLACLAYAQRTTSNELEAYRKANDYYRENVGVSSKTSPSCVRSMQRQADGLWQVLRQGRSEMETEQ